MSSDEAIYDAVSFLLPSNKFSYSIYDLPHRMMPEFLQNPNPLNTSFLPSVIKSEHKEAVELLFMYGIEISLKDASGWSPLLRVAS
ncbi:hypothetical protein AOQ84DRAFT_376503 [Glonium stellatum]|uniref:Ankyrin repeat protein n=1 Tax=Glonium stellatum TaxID=574774 RepID=A0A8E2F181_9PEZI|nr:hypothetical protein AOQ84DRAFT_376503 [Glonium stellatum]